MQPTCASKPCGPNSVLLEGKCRTPVMSCPPSQRLIVNEYGEGECDCAPGLVYFEATRMCYAPYSQGPCLPGHVIKVSASGNVIKIRQQSIGTLVTGNQSSRVTNSFYTTHTGADCSMEEGLLTNTQHVL